VNQLERMCHSKQTYLDEIVAKIEVEKVLKKYGTTVTPYRCPNCKFWHLTSKGLKP
jgi:hypothetical protein